MLCILVNWGRPRPVYKENSSCLEKDPCTSPTCQGITGNSKDHPLQCPQTSLSIFFVKDKDLICLGNQNTRCPGLFQRTSHCPNFANPKPEKHNILESSLNAVCFIRSSRSVLSNGTFCGDGKAPYLCCLI